MTLFQLCLVIAAFGVLLFLFNQYATFVDVKARRLVNMVIVALVLICLYAFGVMDVLKSTRVPKL